MSTTKEIFLKNKDLRDYLSAIVHADDFKICLAYAKAEMMDRAGVSAEMLNGARAFESLLLSLPDETDSSDEPISSGLSHEPPAKSDPKKPETT